MGGFLTVGYCSRTMDYCFPDCFLEIFVGDKVVIGEIPPVLPPGKTLRSRSDILTIYMCETEVIAVFAA